MSPILRRVLDRLDPGLPFLLVDVGSMGGPEEEWREVLGHPNARLVGFEPDEREFAKLEPNGRSAYHNCALWSREGEALDFHVAQKPDNSSVFPPNMEFLEAFPLPERFRTVRTVRIDPGRVRTLDGVLGGGGLEPDFLKLDTQGSERMILEGGRRALEALAGLKVEVEFAELYKGQPLFAEVDTLLRGAGFELADLRRAYWKRREHSGFRGRGQLVFGDALYFKSLPSFFRGLGACPPGRASAKTLKYALACLVYGLNDRAVAALQRALAEPGADAEPLERALEDVRCHDRWRPVLPLPGAGRLLRLLGGLSRWISRSHLGFADGDPGLGNQR